MIAPVMAIKGNDLYPILKHCHKNSLNSNWEEKVSFIIRAMNKDIFPIPVRMPWAFLALTYVFSLSLSDCAEAKLFTFFTGIAIFSL
jgi:hypothetical protein